MRVKFPRIEDTNYFTNRPLLNDKGEKTGKLIMFRLKGEDEFNYLLVCPYCGEEQEGSVVFKRRPYRIQCKKCERKILVEKLLKKKK